MPAAETPFVLPGPPSFPSRWRLSGGAEPGASVPVPFSLSGDRSPRGCEPVGAAGPRPQDGDGSVPGAQPWELAVPWPVAAGCGRSGVVAARPGAALLQKSLRSVLRPGQVSEGVRASCEGNAGSAGTEAEMSLGSGEGV